MLYSNWSHAQHKQCIVKKRENEIISPYRDITPRSGVKSPRLHLVLTVVPNPFPVVIHGNILFLHVLAPMLPNEAKRPTLLTPVAVLVPWAVVLGVLWVFLPTLLAHGRRPFWPIQECNPIQEGHLTQSWNIPRDFFFYPYRYWCPSSKRAVSGLVLYVAAVVAAGLLLVT
jgi:hypothetical protein